MGRSGLKSSAFSVRRPVAQSESYNPVVAGIEFRSGHDHMLDNLVRLLALEKIEENLFRGVSEDLGFRQLFGGQVLGQALSAASQTVAPERNVHSVHGYFLRPGDASLPIVYQVESPRDGGSFTTRTVSAIQKGRAIFTLMASFHGEERECHTSQ